MNTLEYGIKHTPTGRTFLALTLHDATQAWREQGAPHEWAVVERATTNWKEVE